MSIIKGLLILCAFSSFLTANVFDYAGPHKLEGFALYEGNEQREFKGDLVVRLRDGSAWKVKSTETEKVDKWAVSDLVYVQLRKSFYFFNRFHKFRLHNVTKGESAKAMIIDYGDSPILVFKASDPFAANFEEMPIYARGKEGIEEIVSYIFLMKGKRKILTLTDGTDVEIRDHFDEFYQGAVLYIGIDDKNGYKGPFLITGDGKNAVHTPAYLVGSES